MISVIIKGHQIILIVKAGGNVLNDPFFTEMENILLMHIRMLQDQTVVCDHMHNK